MCQTPPCKQGPTNFGNISAYTKNPIPRNLNASSSNFFLFLEFFTTRLDCLANGFLL